MSELADLADPVKDLNLDGTKSMADLPPEVVSIILEHLTKNETRNNNLGYRLVNSQWRDIIDPLLERRIISGDFPVFPRMTVLCSTSGQDLFRVSQSFSKFPAGQNPFPYNSLVLDGWTGDDDETNRRFWRNLPITHLHMIGDFMSRYGGYLTSFELQDVVFPRMKSVLTLLRSLTSLKLLRVQNVTLHAWAVKPNMFLKTLPSLPNLTTLKVKSDTSSSTTDAENYLGEPGQVAERKDILYVWLIVSYADQLLHLDVEMEELPALQRGLPYYFSFLNGKRVLIGTTSDLAFGILKDLKIYRPNNNFLRRGEVPQLQQLSVTNIADENHPDLMLRIIESYPDLLDLTEFISKYRNTLAKLRLDVNWHTLMGFQVRFPLCVEGVLPPINESSLPMIRCLEMHYSMVNDQHDRDSSIYYTMISRFLAVLLTRFPALETLHFLRFPAIFIATATELETINGTVRAGNPPIVAVKTRLASLEQELYEQNRILQQQHAAIRLEVDDQDQRDELENDIEQEMYYVTTTFNVRRAEILNELAALGVKKQEVVVEHFLESRGIWNTCRNLKLVSASSGDKPDGDVCLIRRPEEV